MRKQSQEVVSGCQFSGNYEQTSARRGKPRFDAQARVLASHAKGGSRLSRPTESGAIHLNPSEWTTNMIKALAGCRTTKKVTEVITPLCHREERANASDVAIHRRTRRFNGIATHPTDARNDARGHAAFTMAEILLSLTIIGVVAAITLPSLTGNINERTWNTQRKALYARFSQAIALMPSLNGYGTLTTNASGSVTADTAAETFVTDGLAKVLKINNICDSDHLADCGIPDKITTLGGSLAFSSFPKTFVEYNSIFNGSYVWDDGGSVYKYSQANTKTAAFETVNGESIAVFYYPYCRPDGNTYEYTQPLVCANFVYDLNGSKGPNTMGKDIGFITALYPTDSVVVAPMPLPQKAGKAEGNGANGMCVAMDSESRLPNRDEAVSLFTNRTLLNFMDNDVRLIWTGSMYSPTLRWDMNLVTGMRNTAVNEGYSYSIDVRCIRR